MTSRRNEAFAFSVLALHACVRLVPWDATPLGTDIEATWRWILHVAWERPLVWGREAIFTHGPYGFLLVDSYHPATYPWRIGLCAAIAIFLACVVWRIVRAQVSSAFAALAWGILLVETLSFAGGVQNLFLHVDFVLLWFAWVREERRSFDRWILHGLVAAVALGALVKFTFLLGGLVPVVVLASREVVERKRFPRVVATFAASFLGFWLLARQPLSALGPYLATSVEIAAGYAESMGLPCPLLDVVLFAAVSVLLLVLCVQTWGPSRRPWFRAHLAAFAALLFLDFKSGFVRGDLPHRIPAAAALLFWLAAALVPRSGVAWTKARIVTSLTALALVVPLLGGMPRTAGERILAWPREALSAVRALSARTRFAEENETALEAIRRSTPIPNFPGAVDLYPARAGLVLAHELAYRPRPVFQSYCAFTPRLLQLNADHLAGSSAPDALLFTVVDWIDGRAPAMDDSLSWPVVLARYDVAGTAAEHLVLRKRERPRAVAWKPLPGVVGSFGRPIALDVPRGGFALWAEIDVHPTPVLRACAFLLRPPILFLTVRLPGGQARSYRLVPGIARAGFLLSPVIEEDDAFARLAAGGRAALPHLEVETIAIGGAEGDDPTWAYGREYDVRLSILELGS